MMYKDSSNIEIDEALEKAEKAFHVYKTFSLKQRANFMRAIALAITALGKELLETAAQETNLPITRLETERARTIFQLNSYADAAEKGDWLEARIDTAIADKIPPKPDLRKMLVPLGPVVVFGASNFPFAYSTAGGDTACAFAAGCPVIVKAHPAHPQTSTLVAKAICDAAVACKMPDGIFAHLYGAGVEVGEYLAKHPLVKAIGFTGSYSGGKALFDWANQRKIPIPVFAEMGSVNPVFLLPRKLETDYLHTAQLLAASITQSMGQFCTNPGLVIAQQSEALDFYVTELIDQLKEIKPAKMLHEGIARNFNENVKKAKAQKGVKLLYETRGEITLGGGPITIAQTNAQTFLSNHKLHEEIFGPYSLLIICQNEDEMLKVAQCLEGQLTATLMASSEDLKNNGKLMHAIQEVCGRFILNQVPTGVEVCLSMQHGGPFPSCTDSRFTAVGADGIKRFARPVAFQNWNNVFLPDELKDENPLNIWRTVNNELTRRAVL